MLYQLQLVDLIEDRQRLEIVALGVQLVHGEHTLVHPDNQRRGRLEKLLLEVRQFFKVHELVSQIGFGDLNFVVIYHYGL